MEQDRDFIFKYIVAHAPVLQNLKDRTRNLVAARITTPPPPPRTPRRRRPVGAGAAPCGAIPAGREVLHFCARQPWSRQPPVAVEHLSEELNVWAYFIVTSFSLRKSTWLGPLLLEGLE